ncbi:MAG TPA: hypothetical protein VIT21_04490 [Chthoniobacterales bacterium]
MIQKKIEELVQAWRVSLVLRELQIAIGLGLLGGALLGLIPGVLVFATGLVARLRWVKPWEIDAGSMTRHLNRVHPELEESAGLWLVPDEELTALQRLQRHRLEQMLKLGSENGKNPLRAEPPRRFLIIGGIFVVVGLAAMIVVSRVKAPNVKPGSASTSASESREKITQPEPGEILPRIIDVQITIAPPAYTRRPSRTISGWNADVEESSIVRWNIRAEHAEARSALIFGEDAVILNKTGATDFELTRRITEPTLYRINLSTSTGKTWSSPEIWSLGVIKDAAPGIQIVEPINSRTIVSAQSQVVPIQVDVTDDYVVKSAHLLATVAKGSGEGVKFREQIVPFTGRNDGRFSAAFNLAELGMEPGDELYFHAVAKDNREPKPNVSRSETRFIKLAGPETSKVENGKTVSGINLVPQYFRSQRQLIIDTEKLIADKSTISQAEFRQRSEDLGVDQKLLRLRYGQFMGDETEPETTDRASQTEYFHATKAGVAGDVPKNLILEHDHEHDHDSAKPADDQPATAEQIIAPFAHQHDSQDRATFFDDQVKGTLKDVLNAMWNAEGRLRVIQPEEALPFEKRALMILKRLQQADRIYVKRVGFEAAPLKIDERRLKGELNDIPETGTAPALRMEPAEMEHLMVINSALQSLEKPTIDRAILEKLDPILTTAATKSPDGFLEGLRALRRLEAGEGNDRIALQKALWKLLPAARRLPERPVNFAPDLAAPYFDALEMLEKRETTK